MSRIGARIGLAGFLFNEWQSARLSTPDLLDVMDYGQYWNDGYAPMGYSAYERACLGWLQPEELKVANGQLTIASLSQSSSTHPKAYLLRNPDRSAEYYILENRQPSRWFPKSIGQGMLFYHIDYDADNWALNAVNTNSNTCAAALFVQMEYGKVLRRPNTWMSIAAISFPV